MEVIIAHSPRFFKTSPYLSGKRTVSPQNPQRADRSGCSPRNPPLRRRRTDSACSPSPPGRAAEAFAAGGQEKGRRQQAHHPPGVFSCLFLLHVSLLVNFVRACCLRYRQLFTLSLYCRISTVLSQSCFQPAKIGFWLGGRFPSWAGWGQKPPPNPMDSAAACNLCEAYQAMWASRSSYRAWAVVSRCCSVSGCSTAAGRAASGSCWSSFTE